MNSNSFIKKWNIRTVILSLIICATSFLHAQVTYGGSAFVTVENEENGKRRVINVTVECKFRDASKAKEDLNYQIYQRRKNSLGNIKENEVSQIEYSITKCDK